MNEKLFTEPKTQIKDKQSLSDLSCLLCGKAKWYYPRGLDNVFWRKKYFYKYGKWIWGDELLEADISRVDIILYMMKPFTTPFLTMLQNKGGDGQYRYE